MRIKTSLARCKVEDLEHFEINWHTIAKNIDESEFRAIVAFCVSVREFDLPDEY